MVWWYLLEDTNTLTDFDSRIGHVKNFLTLAIAVAVAVARARALALALASALASAKTELAINRPKFTAAELEIPFDSYRFAYCHPEP